MRLPLNLIPVMLALASSALLNAEVRVTMGEAMRNAVNKPQPEYSAVARQMKVSGKVEVDVTISPEGAVEDTKVISGNPLLTNSTVNALKKWKFTPFQAGGAATKAVATFSFDFKP